MPVGTPKGQPSRKLSGVRTTRVRQPWSSLSVGPATAGRAISSGDARSAHMTDRPTLGELERAERFVDRHITPSDDDIAKMLAAT